MTNIAEFVSVANDAGGLLTGAASVYLAILGHQFTQRQARRDRSQEIQLKLDALQSDYRAFVQGPEDRTTKSQRVVSSGRHLIAATGETGAKAEEMNLLVNQIDGQSRWLEDLNHTTRWASREPGLADAAWAAGLVNGLLDVMKDSVLTDDDYDYLNDDFFVVLDQPELYDDEARTSLRLDEKAALRLMDKWTPNDAPEDSKRRIRALARYKALAEHNLALLLRGNFAGWDHRSAEDRFAQSCTSTMATLVDELVDAGRQADQRLR